MKKKNKRLACILILIICALMLQNISVSAEETEEKKVVRVAVGINNALYLNDEGKPEGYCATYIQQLAWLENWKLEYVEGSWNESVQKLYDGTIDLLLPTQMTEDRSEKMAYSSYIGGYQPIGLYAKDDADIYFNDYENFNNKKIAISKDTSNSEELELFANTHNITYTSVQYNTAQDKINALNNGDVDLIAFSTFNDVTGGKVVAILDYLPFYYCTNISNTELLNELNDGMRQIMSSYPDMVSEQYMNTIKSSKFNTYTREENDVIEKTDKIVFGVYANSLPLSGVAKDGSVIGIYVDLLKKLEEKSGIEIEVKAIDRNKNIYDEMLNGKIDFVMGTKNMAYNASDTSRILASDAIMEYITVAVTRANYHMNSSAAPTFALTNARKYWESYINENYPDSRIKYYDSSKECMVAVQTGKADATLINSWEYNYQSKNARFENLIEWESIRLHSDLVVGTTNNTDILLLSVVDKAFGRISQDEKDAIIASNVNMTYVSYDMYDKLFQFKNMIITVSSIILFILIVFITYLLMRKNNEKKLKEKNSELEQANKAKSDFLSRMSHELRTPLNAINGYNDLMKQNINSNELDVDLLEQNLSNSGRASRYLLAIINDILDIQNIESGKIKLIAEEINVEKYMQNVIDIMKREAEEKNIEFTYEILTHFSDSYMIDGVRVQQILLNILSNAIKFTEPKGRVKMMASSICEEENVFLKFVIEDTGIGMSKEFVKEKLFEKFAQENTGITSPYEGCGTGLAISKQLAELMGGTIECTSEKGKGTTFAIIIKAEPVKSRRKRKKSVKPVYDLHETKVLICEDNPINQDMEKMILEKINCKVDIAEDGKIGLDKFIKSPLNYYDVILMDIRMPNMDGLEATSSIRSLDREDAKNIPILAVSANAFEEDVNKSIKAGMNEHLAKPVDARIMYEKIAFYCNVEK